MKLRDLIALGLGSIFSHRMRTVLSIIGIAIGITSVMLLTSIGEGTRQYIVDQFTQFGTNIMAVNPGKTKTLGIPGALGGTTRKLTLDDAEAILRVPGVDNMVPVAMGMARVQAEGKGRSVYIYGVTADVPEVWKFNVRLGSFWPRGDPRRGAHLTVIGPTLKRELFGEENALGRYLRIGGTRFQVIGIMEPKGQMLGFDIDDAAYIPVASAMKLFNLDELMEIDVVYAHAGLSHQVEKGVRRLLIDRHGGYEDFTLTTQTAMLEVFDKVLSVITMSVGAIAGISLLVGAIGILTMMWIAVGERTSEIGLLRAVGATAGQVHALFLFEAIILAGFGGLAGVLVGAGIKVLLRLAVPGLPVETPPEYVIAAILVSLATGLASGVLPARRAASLEPVESLRSE
ncbi:ABC transporter permease [Acidobacteriota bacterium]